MGERERTGQQGGNQQGAGQGTATAEQDRPLTAEDMKRIEEAHRVKPATQKDVQPLPNEQEGDPVASGTGHGPVATRRRGRATSTSGGK